MFSIPDALLLLGVYEITSSISDLNTIYRYVIAWLSFDQGQSVAIQIAVSTKLLTFVVCLIIVRGSTIWKIHPVLFTMTGN